MAPSDDELLNRIQRRDRSAFEALTQRHERTLRIHLQRYVEQQDVADLLQETWLRLWDRASQWDSRGAPLAWLLRIATNLALNHIRDRRSKAWVSLSESDEDDEDMPSPSRQFEEAAISTGELAEWRDQAYRLLDLVDQMPADRQNVLCMARLDGMKLADIAGDLKLPLGTVKSRLHSATQWLTERWEDEE